jgi:hypothetical protein
MAYSSDERAKLQAVICAEIADGASRRKAAEIAGCATSLITKWLLDDPEFEAHYARAREARADARSERIDELADEVRSGVLRPDAARVIIDAEKWQAGKENHRRYGDRVQVDGDMSVKLTDDQLDSRLAQLLGKAGVGAAAGGAGKAEGETEVS